MIDEVSLNDAHWNIQHNLPSLVDTPAAGYREVGAVNGEGKSG